MTPTGVAGLDFNDEADTVNALVPQLRAQGVDAIVVLVHQGGFQTGPNSATSTAATATCSRHADIAKIVKRLDDAVDLVISGHTHAGTTARPSRST